MEFEEAKEAIESHKKIDKISFDVNERFESIVEWDGETSSTEHESKETVRWTILHVAVQAANVSAVNFLLSQGADFSSPSYTVVKIEKRRRPVGSRPDDWSEWQKTEYPGPTQSAFEMAKNKAACDSNQKDILKLFEQYQAAGQNAVSQTTKLQKTLVGSGSKDKSSTVESKASLFPAGKHRKVGVSHDASRAEPVEASASSSAQSSASSAQSSAGSAGAGSASVASLQSSSQASSALSRNQRSNMFNSHQRAGAGSGSSSQQGTKRKRSPG